MADDARQECKDRMREKMFERLRRFYEQERPELYRDERSIIAIARSLDGMSDCLTVLDDYEITRRPPTVVVIIEGKSA